MRFINTDFFSPVYNGLDLPKEGDLFYHSPDVISGLNTAKLIDYYNKNNIVIDDAWWEKQYSRCIYGYTVKNTVDKGGDYLIDGRDAFWNGDDVVLPEYDITIRNREVHISGRHYFYLNFWKIRRMVDGFVSKQYSNPRFLALDYIFAACFEMMYKYGKDHQDVKGRQVGYSEKIAGMGLTYNYLFLPFSQNIIVAGEQTDANNTFQNCLRGIDNLSNTQFKLKTVKRTESNEPKIRSITGSEIIAEQANNDPEALSRYSPTLVVCEEVGKGKYGWSIKLGRHVLPSIKAEGGKRTGYIVYLGTGGNNEDGVADLQERTYNPDEYDILSFTNKWSKDGDNYTGDVKVGHFIPKTSFRIVDEWGNPLVQDSIKDINEENEKIKGANKHISISANAIFLDDVFLSNKTGYFGPERIRALAERKSDIINHKALQITRKGWLEWNTIGVISKGVHFVDASDEDIANGSWWLEIVEEPECDMGGVAYMNLYVGGTDTYMQDEAETSDSEGAMLVYKRARINSDSPIFNTWVALLKERPSSDSGGQRLFFEHTLMLSIYYNLQNNIEYVNPLIFEYYEKIRATQYLMERPVLAFAGKIKKEGASNRYGTDKSLKPYKLIMLRDMLDSAQIERMYLIPVIDAYIKYRVDKHYNCDITSAAAETAVGFEEKRDWSVVSTEDVAEETNGRWVNIDGVLQRVFV